MPTLANNANVTLNLTDFDSVTISTLGVATVAAVSGLGVAAGKIGEFTGSRTLGPFTAGSLSIAASVRDCQYEVADGVRPVEQSGAGAVAAITGSYVVGQTLTATFPAGITGTIQFTRTLAAAPFTKTAISGAVASAVNSLTYTVQSADAGNVLGVDCTTVQAGVGGVVAGSAAPTTLRTIESFNTVADNTNAFARYVYSEINRTAIIIRNPVANTVSIELGFRDADNIVNGNSDFSSKVTLAPGQEMFSDNDSFQYWVRQNVTPAVAGQTHEIERVITL